MKIIFTGGGTAGHAMVNTILIPYFQKQQWQVAYIGSKQGMEKAMVKELSQVTYHQISTGKLRRYFSLKNVTDLFLLLKGFFQALAILKKEKAQLVYSSGGYVAVPVVWAAHILRISIILRETDSTTGLANKLCLPFADKIYRTFPEVTDDQDTSFQLSAGMIIRPSLYNVTHADPVQKQSNKAVCLVIGGSSGATKINQFIWDNIDVLAEKYCVIHICGRGNANGDLSVQGSYEQCEFVNDMGQLYDQADVVITRSGSNVVIECLLLGKPMICLPLSNQASRGEQLVNAQFAEKHSHAGIIREEDYRLNPLLQKIEQSVNQKKVMPFQISQEVLIERIQEHVTDIITSFSTD